jgi:FkbM family methyltransferase
LKRTLELITNQSYKDLEIIVSDNASTDETSKVVEDFMEKDHRIQYIKHEKNQGIQFNFKYVLQVSRGQYFMWAADDDEWALEFIDTCVKNTSGSGTCMTWFSTLYRSSGKISYPPQPNILPEMSVFSRASSYLGCMQSSYFYGLHKRADIQEVLQEGFFDFYDCYFILRQLIKYDLKIIPKYLFISGVDSENYELKTFENRKCLRLNYFSFISSSLRLISRDCQFNLFQRVYLIFKLLFSMFKLMIFNEVIEPARTFYSKASRFLKRRWLTLKHSMYRGTRISYAQAGEDLIIRIIFDAIGVEKPSYIDIGAHHPYYFSNTALFYLSDSQGVNIEADPELFKRFVNLRTRDINLNSGVLAKRDSDTLLFHVLSNPTLNTFSKTEAENSIREAGIRILKEIPVPVMTLNEIIQQYCDGDFPDFLSLDIEGMDLEVLKSIDFSNSVPTVICVESVSFSESGRGVKNKRIGEFLSQKGYFLYADTHINSIFVLKSRWLRN